MSCKVCVLGTGAIGTALAQLMASNGHRVAMWGIEEEVVGHMGRWRRNPRYLPGVLLHRLVTATTGLAEAMDGAEMAVVAVPSQAVREVARRLAPYLSENGLVLNVAKGLEGGTGLRMSQVLAQELPGARIATMGGPALSHEVGRRRPTVLVVASQAPEAAHAVGRILEGQGVRVLATDDVCGVEMAATLKNVYAIALGMCESLGANAKASLVCLALREMVRIATALGSRSETILGWAGLGDLLASGYSRKGRNVTLGRLLGRGGPWQPYLERTTVEGVQALGPLRYLLRERGLEAPILEAVAAVLEGREEAKATVRRLISSLPLAL